MKLYAIIILSIPFLFCDVMQQMTGPHITVISQNFNSDTFGLRTYHIDTMVDQQGFDSLLYSGQIYGGIKTNGLWTISLEKKEWLSIDNSFTINYRNDGIDTAYQISFALKIVTGYGSSDAIYYGRTLYPGYQDKIVCDVPDDARSVEIDKIHSN